MEVMQVPELRIKLVPLACKRWGWTECEGDSALIGSTPTPASAVETECRRTSLFGRQPCPQLHGISQQETHGTTEQALHSPRTTR